MGILDDAIREHLDLKRRHGAREAELREIEDEAFGAGDQPDPFAAGGELFNEVSAPAGEGAPTEGAPGATALSEPDVGDEEPTRLVEPEALRQTDTSDEAVLDLPEEPASPPEGLEQIPGQAPLPGQDEIPGQETLDEAAEPPSPSQSLEELIAEEEPFPEDTRAPHAGEELGPSTDRGGALEGMEPELAEPEPAAEPEPEPLPPESSVPEPPPPPPAAGSEPPGRARGRVDVPTQEHPPPGQTGDLPPFPSEPDAPVEEPAAEVPPIEEPEPSADADAPALYDFESDEDPAPPAASPVDDEFEALGPAEEEAPYLDEERPYADDPGSGGDLPVDEPSTAVRPALEDEEAYEGGGLDPEEGYEEEDDDLWFEKGPPKDFDF